MVLTLGLSSYSLQTTIITLHTQSEKRDWAIGSCLSVRLSYQFMIEAQRFQFNVIFWTLIGAWMGSQTCCWTELYLWIFPDFTCAESSKVNFFRLSWMPGSQTKSKIILNRNATVFKGVIKDIRRAQRDNVTCWIRWCNRHFKSAVNSGIYLYDFYYLYFI